MQPLGGKGEGAGFRVGRDEDEKKPQKAEKKGELILTDKQALKLVHGQLSREERMKYASITKLTIERSPEETGGSVSVEQITALISMMPHLKSLNVRSLILPPSGRGDLSILESSRRGLSIMKPPIERPQW
jgi:hypothetical protein